MRYMVEASQIAIRARSNKVVSSGAAKIPVPKTQPEKIGGRLHIYLPIGRTADQHRTRDS